MPTATEIHQALLPIKDPEIGLSVIDLGLIYNIDPDPEGGVKITMTLTTPACPYGPELVDAVRLTVSKLKGVKSVDVEVVWEPQWNPQEMASDYAKDVLGIW